MQFFLIKETVFPKQIFKFSFIILVRSGHIEFQTLYAANDVVTPNFVVNGLGAPNDSTTVVSTFLVAKLLNNYKCPSEQISATFREKVIFSATN